MVYYVRVVLPIFRSFVTNCHCAFALLRFGPVSVPTHHITERTLPERHRHFARPLGLSLNFAAAHHRHGLRGTEAQ